MERHPFSDISWQVTEPEYRKDPALSYSTISKYEREGKFKALPTLFDEVSTPSLVFGSMVDTLMTGSEQEFKDTFVIMEDPGISDTLKDITSILYSMNKVSGTQFDDIPDSVLAEVGKDQMYYAGDKYEQTRVKKIRESCKPYYNMLRLAEGKKVVTSEDVTDARACVEVLKKGVTANYFKDNDPFGNNDAEGYYQLKFKGVSPDGVTYRCMADRILVNHKLKVVIPVDLKTSSHEEHEFYRSFTQWRYDLQARLYWRLIRMCMDKDEYYKDFKLLDYRFVVVNRKTLIPLVWEFPLTQAIGQLDIDTPSGYKYHLRDPYVIGAELHKYLTDKPRVPFNVFENKPNNLVEFIRNN